MIKQLYKQLEKRALFYIAIVICISLIAFTMWPASELAFTFWISATVVACITDAMLVVRRVDEIEEAEKVEKLEE